MNKQIMVVILNILISYSFAIHTSRLVRANNGGSKHFHRLCVCMFKLGWRKSRARKYRSQISWFNCCLKALWIVHWTDSIWRVILHPAHVWLYVAKCGTSGCLRSTRADGSSCNTPCTGPLLPTTPKHVLFLQITKYWWSYPAFI